MKSSNTFLANAHCLSNSTTLKKHIIIHTFKSAHLCLKFYLHFRSKLLPNYMLTLQCRKHCNNVDMTIQGQDRWNSVKLAIKNVWEVEWRAKCCNGVWFHSQVLNVHIVVLWCSCCPSKRKFFTASRLPLLGAGWIPSRWQSSGYTSTEWKLSTDTPGLQVGGREKKRISERVKFWERNREK